MSEQLSIDEIYQSETCGGSVFRAVVMMAQEARFINEQANMGFIKLNKKPTSIAMHKFKLNKLDTTEKKSAAAPKQAEIDSADDE